MSSFTRAMSAASTAMSLPTPPMAMPTWARFRAGASLIPSPIMQTRWPALLAAVDPGELILRQARLEGADAQLSGDMPGRVLVVPGEQHRGHAGGLTSGWSPAASCRRGV